jgi:hypothetical protein
MELNYRNYYKDLSEEEIARQIANIPDEDDININYMLKKLRSDAGANHPLTVAYYKEYQKREAERLARAVEGRKTK